MPKKQDIKRLLASAESMTASLDRFERFLNSLAADFTDENLFTKLSTHLEAIQELNDKHADICIDLSVLSEGSANVDRDEFFDRFIDLTSKATCILNKRAVRSTPNAALSSNSGASSVHSSNGINARLPKITLPTFDGNYQEFTSFYETFKALVHDNNSLTDVERFLHLRSSLKSEASQLIANVQPTSANYRLAFDLLCERYNNPKCIIQSHVKGIFDIQPVSKGSALELRKLHDELNKHIRSLQNFDMPVAQWSVFISHILLTKFDNLTKVEFSKVKPKEILTLEEIGDFLKNRMMRIIRAIR